MPTLAWIMLILAIDSTTDSYRSRPACRGCGPPSPQQHLFWTPGEARFKEPGPDGLCHFTVLASATRQEKRTLFIDGVYQGFDIGWTLQAALRPGEERELVAVFRAGDPVAERRLTLRCESPAPWLVEWRQFSR
jgi:hypothetical protein